MKDLLALRLLESIARDLSFRSAMSTALRKVGLLAVAQRDALAMLTRERDEARECTRAAESLVERRTQQRDDAALQLELTQRDLDRRTRERDEAMSALADLLDSLPRCTLNVERREGSTGNSPEHWLCGCGPSYRPRSLEYCAKCERHRPDGDPSAPCGEIATRACERGGERYCDKHGDHVPEYPRAAAVRAAQSLIGASNR